MQFPVGKTGEQKGCGRADCPIHSPVLRDLAVHGVVGGDEQTCLEISLDEDMDYRSNRGAESRKGYIHRCKDKSEMATPEKSDRKSIDQTHGGTSCLIIESDPEPEAED